MLVVPVIMEMLMLLGDSAEIEYKTGLEKEKKEITEGMMAKAVSRFKKKVDETDTTKEPEEPIVEDTEDDKPAGLMARRT